mgnify:CR=1 FL=1
MAGYDDGETINSIPRHHNDHVTTDYICEKEGHMLHTKCFCNGAVRCKL